MKKNVATANPAVFARVAQLIRANQLDSAEQLLRDVLKKNPVNPEALRMLGDVYFFREDFQRAFDLSQRSLSLRVSYETLKLLAASAEMLHLTDIAEKNYRVLIKMCPQDGESYFRLALLLNRDASKAQELIKCLEVAIKLGYQISDSYTLMGHVANMTLWDRDMARTCFLKALEANPQNIEALIKLALLYWTNNHVEDAMALLHRVLEIDPNQSDAYYLFSTSFLKLGRHEECQQFFEKAVKLAPDDFSLYSSYLNSINYTDTLSRQEWFEKHCAFNDIVSKLATRCTSYANSPDPTRKLRVGYVSADLCSHSVAFFFEPLLECYDKEQFEIFCYYNNRKIDEVTLRLKALADGWRDVSGLRSAELVELIREDGIDLLIDLTGHTANNRLTTFAWKPAPVQFTWLGYGPTTGMDTIDYIFTDRYYTPNEEEEQFFSEKPVYLNCYRVFKPPFELPVNPLPALEKGYVTFGSFNSFNKVSHEQLLLWSDILLKVPESRLSIIVNAKESVDYVKQLMLSQGIAEERLMIFTRLRYDHFLQLHSHVDIALDCYPFTGFTTSFNGLWMGVPMITMTGVRMCSRTGLGLLGPLGLESFVSHSREEYVEKACYWAENLDRLAEIRAGLRDQLTQSILMDGVAFTRDFESILRRCWVDWCTKQSGS